VRREEDDWMVIGEMRGRDEASWREQ